MTNQAPVGALRRETSEYRARQLTPELAHGFGLILAMEAGHERVVESIGLSARGRVFRVGKWGHSEVPDPYRKPREAFEEALELIERGRADVKSRMGLSRS